MQALSYLEQTKRFRETPTYSKTTFKDYLSLRFNMKYTHYNTMKTIYIQYPEEAAKHGVGFLIETQKKVGKKKLPEAIKLVNDAQKERKNSIPLEKKREIVSKLAPEVDKTRTSWKLLYDESSYKMEDLIKEVKERREAMQQMEFRIQELKEENASLKEENKLLKALSKAKRTPKAKRLQREGASAS